MNYLYNAVHYEPNNKNNLVVISSPFYSWIPKFVFHLNNYQYIDYLDDISVKSNRVTNDSRPSMGIRG